MKVRASMIGQIMTNPRTKSELFSETTKECVLSILLENELGYKDEFWSKYTEKGKQVEKESLSMANDILNLGLTWIQIENELQDYAENDFFTGHCDALTDDYVIEIKSSYSAKTYFKEYYSDELKNKAYYFQVQAYMDLFDRDECRLIYCLTNTPELMVEDVVRQQHWKHNLIDENMELRHHVEMQHNFDRINRSTRVKEFRIKRDDETIQLMKERVIQCRELYEQLKSKL